MDALKVVVDFWKCFLTRNKRLTLSFFNPNAMVSFPQYDKKVTPNSFIKNFFERSSFYDIQFHRAEFYGGLVITSVKIFYGDKQSFFLTSFFVLDNLKIIDLEHFYSDGEIPKLEPLL